MKTYQNKIYLTEGKVKGYKPENIPPRPSLPPPSPKKHCECINWCRTNHKFGTEHHNNCPHYLSEIQTKSKDLLTKILKHFREYCNEGDGIPPEAWEDYKQALIFIGDFDRFLKCLEWEKKNSLEVNTL